LTGPSFSRPNLTLGFLGFGRISHSVLSRFLSFTLPASHSDAPKVVYTSSHRRPEQDSIDAEYTKRFGVEVKWVEKEELAQESDVLVVLCNLNESTKGIVGKEFLSNMKETAVLVNTARVSHSLQLDTLVFILLTALLLRLRLYRLDLLGLRGRLARPRRST
jgi:glyoxylate/hydroxypyruvate reductase